MTTARPFLMFQGNNAEEAMAFYVSLFEDGKVIDLIRYEPDGAGPPGSVMKASFLIAGQVFMCTDSPIQHGFTFTPSFSLFVDCESEEEINRLSSLLSERGALLMPLGEYGFSRRFAWVSDRFGVSWQLNLP